MKPTLVIMTKEVVPGNVKTRLASSIGNTNAAKIHFELFSIFVRTNPNLRYSSRRLFGSNYSSMERFKSCATNISYQPPFKSLVIWE